MLISIIASIAGWILITLPMAMRTGEFLKRRHHRIDR